jgi:hypothetical protein
MLRFRTTFIGEIAEKERSQKRVSLGAQIGVRFSFWRKSENGEKSLRFCRVNRKMTVFGPPFAYAAPMSGSQKGAKICPGG